MINAAARLRAVPDFLLEASIVLGSGYSRRSLSRPHGRLQSAGLQHSELRFDARATEKACKPGGGSAERARDSADDAGQRDTGYGVLRRRSATDRVERPVAGTARSVRDRAVKYSDLAGLRRHSG